MQQMITRVVNLLVSAPVEVGDLEVFRVLTRFAGRGVLRDVLELVGCA